MKVLIAGSTGMVGSLILEKCLQSDEIDEVVSLVRKPTTLSHAKLTEKVIEDFDDYTSHETLFQNIKASFFCIGAYTGQVPKNIFKKITVDYAVAFAKTVQKNSPNANLCMLSGAGADRTEKSRTAFAKFKGMAENQIATLGMNFYSFRPGYIYPVTKRQEPNLMYRVSRRLYPFIKLLGKNASITSVELANAMFNVGLYGANKGILENRDILNFVISPSTK